MFSLRPEGVCSFDVFYGGLGISKLQFFIKKRYNKISAVIFSSIFGYQNPGSRFTWNAGSGSTTLIQTKLLLKENPDPNHFAKKQTSFYWLNFVLWRFQIQQNIKLYKVYIFLWCCNLRKLRSKLIGSREFVHKIFYFLNLRGRGSTSL